MNIIQHTLAWTKGELFESKMIILFGITTVVLGWIFYKIGTTPNAKAMFIPLFVIGLIYTVIGSNMLYSNQRRMIEYPIKFKENKTEFLHVEKIRVESFQYQYKISKVVATICFLMTIFIFLFTKTPTWQGIGIGLSLFGLVGLIVDFFSEERANIYYHEILKLIQK